MNKKNLIIITILLAFSLQATTAEKKPLSFAEFIHMKRVSDLQLSPSGDRLALTVTEMDLENNKSNSDIWIIHLESRQNLKLTSNPTADFNPRWSPDGNRIAFISTRDGSPQIWTIDLQGGEAQPLTAVATGATGLIWSPTGKNMAFISEVYPDCPDMECNAKKVKEREKSQVQAEIFDELLFRHWNSWREGRRSHVFMIPARGGVMVDLTPGDFDTPPISLGGNQDYTFSPDGKEICFVRNTDPELRKGIGTNNDLFIRRIGNSAIKKITTNRANDNSPNYSPDGKYIAYRAMERPGFEADKYSLLLYDRANEKASRVTEGLDRSVDEILWAPESRSIYFTCSAQGRTELYSYDLKTEQSRRLLSNIMFTSSVISPDGQTLYFLKQSIDVPSEVYSFDLRKQITEKISCFNDTLLSDIDMNPAEDFWFAGAAGDKVHGLLVRPPFFDKSKKYPHVMLIHGGPQGAWSDNFHFRWNAQMFAAQGYVVSMINFHGSTGYGQKFTDSISGDWGGKPYEDIMKGLDHIHSNYKFIDSSRVGAAGASYGGYMINWIEGHTDKFTCLISHAGVYDLRSMYGATEELWFPEWEFRGTPWTSQEQYEKWSPSYFVQNFKTPCLVIHGQHDYRVPVTQGFQLFTSLQRMNVPSRLLYFPDEYHFVTKPQNARLWWKTMFEWLADYLK